MTTLCIGYIYPIVQIMFLKKSDYFFMRNAVFRQFPILEFYKRGDKNLSIGHDFCLVTKRCQIVQRNLFPDVYGGEYPVRRPYAGIVALIVQVFHKTFVDGSQEHEPLFIPYLGISKSLHQKGSFSD